MPYIEYSNDADSDIKNDNTKLIPSDKNFHKIIRKVVDNTKTVKMDDGKTYYKKVAIGIYGNGQVGTRIRNAVTGHKYKYLVGSKEQNLLFSVALCTGENGVKHSIAMFYDSPEQYESHMFSKMDITQKSAWYSNRLILS